MHFYYRTSQGSCRSSCSYPQYQIKRVCIECTFSKYRSLIIFVLDRKLRLLRERVIYARHQRRSSLGSYRDNKKHLLAGFVPIHPFGLYNLLIFEYAGMSHEKTYPADLEASFKIYSAATPLLSSLESDIPRSIPTAATGADLLSFTQYRELWRWVDRLLWRAIVIAARISVEDTALLALFHRYHACSAHWPSTFRPEHRSAVAVLHLHFLVSRVNSSTKVRPTNPSWLSSARSVIQEYRSVLSSSTQFPRAGDRNVKVEDFVDLCVAVWEASGAVGEHAGWVIDVSALCIFYLSLR